MIRRAIRKTNSEIVREWDDLAQLRYEQIITGRDLSYHNILLPTILKLLSSNSKLSGVDAGCGIGFLSHILARKQASVIGVDPSERSVAIAREHYGSEALFIHSSLEDFASEKNVQKFDFVVANMVLMDVLDLHEFISAAYRILKPTGVFVFTVTHPWFWPNYYGYANEPWYHYDIELIVESPFRITTEPDCQLFSTHIHRPLEVYISSLLQAQFSIDALAEPMPSQEIEAFYPRPWSYPRYLAGRCRR
jgi:SAM-dependent methyltransferase